MSHTIVTLKLKVISINIVLKCMSCSIYQFRRTTSIFWICYLPHSVNERKSKSFDYPRNIEVVERSKPLDVFKFAASLHDAVATNLKSYFV